MFLPTTLFLRFFAPHDCLSCGLEGKILCDLCQFQGLGAVPSRCYRCRKQTQDFAVCQQCRSKSRLKHVWVVSEYGGVSKGLIHKLKFERAQAAADTAAELIAEKLPYLPSGTIVTFAPTASSRRRLRGYDQSELIARKLAALKGLKFNALLIRTGQSRQVGSKKEVRHQQLVNAFRVLKRTKAQEKTILLIDDITTTGATIEMAAKTLKLAGAKQVNAAVFAQKL